MAKIVLIYGGHVKANGDPGAVSGEFVEADLNAKVASAACDYLSSYDCEVINGTGRTTSANIVAAKQKKVAALVNCHHNAGGGDGGEVYHWHTDTKSKVLAELVAAEFKAIGQNLRGVNGVKTSTASAYNFAPCREMAKVGLIGILGEFAFVDNTTDRTIIDTDAELTAEGQAYGKAVVKFLGLKLKTPVIVTQEIPPTVTPTKSTEEIAREVIKGLWGNGNDRINKLKAAGYDPFVIQAAVNKMIMATRPTTTLPIVPTPLVVPDTPVVVPQEPVKPPVVIKTTAGAAIANLLKSILAMFKK